MKPIVVELLRCCEKNNVIGEAHWQILENALQGTDDLVIKIYGYKYSRFKNLLFHLISILLCGIPYLILSWYPKRKVLKYCKCSLKMADLIVVTDNEGTCKIEKVLEIDLNLPNYSDTKMRYFLYQHTRYIWLNDQATFINVQNLNDKMTVNLLMENTSGINKRQQEELTKLYGSNSIEVEVKSYWSLFINEVFNPFYLFQVFSIILWSLDEYYHYAGCVFLISAGSVITSLYQTKKLSLALRELVGASSANQAEVVRPGREAALVSASRLVPGDVLQLPPGGCVMPCDALLLTGTCIVNESMLTGESVPVMKSPPNMNSEYYSVNTHKRHTLFAGTKVIQTRFYGNNMVLAKVVRTGFYTSKGELVKSILFPKPIGFQFYKDAVKFVIFLFCLSAMGMVYCVWLYIERGSELKTILLRTLDIITIVVPPALPAAMTAGTVYSQRRLKRNQIFCISPPRINICGKMRLICFDKTGTLTEDGLDLYAVIPNSEDCFGKLEHHVSALPNKSPIMQALASCHSLTSIDGQLTGDPLDLKMFEATEWVLEEPGPENTRYDSLAPAVVKPATTNEAALQNEDLDPLTLEIPYEIGLIRRFHFSSTQQSMGVIARVLGQPQMLYFVKGAPEKVASMCRTLPENFSRVLNEYASKGFRVIALAYKKLERKLKWMDAQRVKREQIEVDLTFLGLLVMQNSLKPATTSVIRELYEARIRMVMVTGDNIMTAISVSRDCCMIPQAEKVILISHYIPNELEGGEHVTHCSPSSGDGAYRPELRFEVVGAPPSSSLPQVSISLSTTLQTDNYCFAMDGRTWAVVRQHYPDLMPAILAKGTVFGRFGPEQKTQLVMGLQGDDWVVGMCGDGANDCGALKAAHIGISLSQAEASVAAPFTSRVQDISCVKLLTLEGRCALSTSFAIFKYMALYSLIQFFSVLILYNSFSILGNMQFLYVDLILTTSLALAMGRTGPARVLATRSPPVSLVGPATTVPLLVQVVICLVIQLGAMYVLEMQTWFKAVEGGPDVEEVLCWENTVIFIVSSFQYLILAGVYSKGEPFRQPFCTNYHLLGTLVILTIFTTFLLFCPWKWLASFMEVEVFRFNETKVNIFRLYLLLMPLFHLILSAAVELAISDSMKLKELLQSLAPKKSQCDDRTDALAKQLETSPWLEVLHKESVAC